MIKWDVRERTYFSKTQGKERSWQGTRIRWPAISQDGLLQTPPPLMLLLHFQPAELWEKAVQITQPGASYDDTGHLSLLIPKSLWARALQRNRTNWINTGGDVYYVWNDSCNFRGWQIQDQLGSCSSSEAVKQVVLSLQGKVNLLLHSGLWLTGLIDMDCIWESMNLKGNHVPKYLPRNNQNLVWSTTWAPHCPVRLTHRIHHHGLW